VALRDSPQRYLPSRLSSPLLIILCVFHLEAHQKRVFSVALQVLSITSVCLAAATLMIALVALPMDTRVGRVRTSVYDPVVTAIDEHVRSGTELFIYPYEFNQYAHCYEDFLDDALRGRFARDPLHFLAGNGC
jgi:hypothetical protein